MSNPFTNDNVVYTEEDLNRFAKEWKKIVDKASMSILKDSHWATEILDDLLMEFRKDKLHVDFERNPDGYIYKIAQNRARNIYNRVVKKQPVCLDDGAEGLSLFPDEDGRSPAEQACWESRGELVDHAFEQLVRHVKENGRVRDPHKMAQMLREYLSGDKSCKELAKEFKLSDPNYPAVLKNRFCGILRRVIDNAA